MTKWSGQNRLKLCQRCGFELEGGEESCPSCNFAPKSKGLKVSGYVLLIVPILWIVGILLMPVDSSFTSTLMLVSLVVFFIAALMYIVSMVARPHRLGGLFLRFR